jgi:hypothetical protein
MKTIDRSYTTTKKTVCPFCSFGCEFGLVFNDFGLSGVEYLKDGSSEGRLCPRGSAAALYLNHPKRLSMPIKDGKPVEWVKVEKDIRKTLEKPKNVAVTFDRNITIEEYHALTAFCRNSGIEYTASTYCEPEALLRRFLETPTTSSDIDDCEMIVVVGDPFNQTPMISKSLINWKFKARNNRLVVIDSIRTHTAHFASDFCQVTAGTEALALLGLAGETSGVDIAAVSGFDSARIDEIGSSFKAAKKGLIVVSLSFAHSYDPLLLVEGISRLQQYSGKDVMPLVEFAGFDGSEHFGTIVELIRKKKIRHLLNFGELFPFYYPQLGRALKGVNIYATSPIKQNDYTTLPVALNLEKQGSLLTNSGKKKLDPAIEPASGARTVTEILSHISDGSAQEKAFSAPAVTVDVKMHAEALARKAQTPKKKTLTLLGEKIAYNFLGLLEGAMLKVHPSDAHELGIRQNDEVTVKSKHGETVVRTKLTNDTAPGVVVVPAENPDVRGIFDYEIMNNIVCFIPTEVQLWRKE